MDIAENPYTDIEYTDELVVISDAFTSIYGAGANASAAIIDFQDALEQYFNLLIAKAETLSPDLQRRFAYLRRHLREER